MSVTSTLLTCTRWFTLHSRSRQLNMRLLHQTIPMITSFTIVNVVALGFPSLTSHRHLSRRRTFSCVQRAVLETCCTILYMPRLLLPPRVSSPRLTNVFTTQVPRQASVMLMECHKNHAHLQRAFRKRDGFISLIYASHLASSSGCREQAALSKCTMGV